MYRYLIVIATLICISFYLDAQNLVQNPGFELFEQCPQEYTVVGQKFKLPGWFSPSKGTPDYFNNCSRGTVGVPVNFMGHQWAVEGHGYIGIILTENPDLAHKKAVNEREYVSTHLLSPLIKDSLYILSFYYAVAPNSTYGVNQLGVCLSHKKPKCKRVFKCIPQVSIDTSVIDTITGSWELVIDTIKAKGNEHYLTIGNFYTDSQLSFYELDLTDHRKSLQETIKMNKLAYYFIDRVELKKFYTRNGK